MLSLSRFRLLLAFTLVVAHSAGAQEGVDRYKPRSPLLYQLEFTADFGTPKYDVKLTGILEYEIKSARDNQLVVSTSGLSSSAGSYYSRPPEMFPIGPLRYFHRSRLRTSSTMSTSGVPVSIDRPNWLSGLPFDVGRLVFPQLSDETQWSADQPVTLIRNTMSSGYLQLMPVSPEIKSGSGASYPITREEQESKKVAIIKITRTRVEETETTSMIEESYLLQGVEFNPQVTMSGTGKFIFNRDLGSIDSIDRNFEITVKSKNGQMTVPISFQIERLTGDALAKHQAQRKAAEDAAKERLAKRQAMEDAIPDVDDRQAMIATLKGDSKEEFDVMVKKMYERKLANDPELARILYARVLDFPSVTFFTQKVIAQLDPALEQSAAIADKYDGSFDISLTGDALTKDAKLAKRQIVCYPHYSSWHAGRFYGSVDEVIVLESIEREPKLLAFKREKCRLPTPLFVDVNAAK